MDRGVWKATAMQLDTTERTRTHKLTQTLLPLLVLSTPTRLSPAPSAGEEKRREASFLAGLIADTATPFFNYVKI